MNIQAKINQLKTSYEVNITYLESNDNSVLAVICFEVYLGEEMREVVEEEFKGVPAIQRGAVAVIEDGTPLAASGTPSALSIPATIDEYLKIISEAAGK